MLRQRLVAFIVPAIIVLSTSARAAVPSLISIQGRLTDALGEPLPSGNKGFAFRIYSDSTGGTAMWPAAGAETQVIASDDNGLWNGMLGAVESLDESVFSSDVRWLEIRVNDGVNPTVTLPRVRLVTGPYAFHVQTVDGATGGTITSSVSIGAGHSNTGNSAFAVGSDNIASGDHAIALGQNNRAWAAYSTIVGGGGATPADSNYTYGDRSSIGGGLKNSTGSTGAVVGGGNSNHSSGTYSVVSGGSLNEALGSNSTVSGGLNNSAHAGHSTVGGGSGNHARGIGSVVAGGGGITQSDSNSAIGDYSAIGGGQMNLAEGEYAVVGGGVNNSTAGINAVIAGGSANIAAFLSATVGGGDANTAGQIGATVGGGSNNSSSGEHATVGGGLNNTADGQYSVVGGGSDNQALPLSATVGGGALNIAGGIASTISGGADNDASQHHATIGGGDQNLADGEWATIAGGQLNVASGTNAAVPGGRLNEAIGANSFAAGRRAKALHDGCFVWADDHGVDFASTDINQFMIRALGGVAINTDSVVSILTIQRNSPTDPVADSWDTYSSRRWKKDIEPIHNALETVEKLQGVTYRWKADDKKDIGLIAEDVGAVVPEIVTYEANGVDAQSVDYARLVALLIEAVKEQQAKIQTLESRLNQMSQ